MLVCGWGQLAAAPQPSTAQDGASCGRRHALPESMHPHPAADLRLISSLRHTISFLTGGAWMGSVHAGTQLHACGTCLRFRVAGQLSLKCGARTYLRRARHYTVKAGFRSIRGAGDCGNVSKRIPAALESGTAGTCLSARSAAGGPIHASLVRWPLFSLVAAPGRPGVPEVRTASARPPGWQRR